MITSGVADGQIRKITSYTSATEVEVDSPWTVSPFASDGFTEVDPAASDTFAVSYNLDDLDDAVDLHLDATGAYRLSNTWTISNDVFVADNSIRFEFDSADIVLGNGATMRFGDINNGGYTENPCYLVDTATGFDGFGTGSGDAGDLHIYGGIVEVQSTSDIFWRVNRGSDQIVRLFEVQFDGDMGGRFQGSQSIIKDCTFRGGDTNIGPFTPKSPFGLISGIKVQNFNQGLYYHWNLSLSSEASDITFENISTRGIRVDGTTTSHTFTLKNIDIDSLAALPVLFNSDDNVPANTVRFANPLNAEVRDSSLALITDDYEMVIEDAQGNVLKESTSTGTFSEIDLRYEDIPSASGDQNFGDGTRFSPHDIALWSYGYEPSVVTNDMKLAYDLSIQAIPDTNITETDNATVLAYSQINNLDMLYDYSKAWKTNGNGNLEIPTIDTQLIDAMGTQLVLPDTWNMDIIADAATAFEVDNGAKLISIKSPDLRNGSSFTSISTVNGVITLVNGATLTGVSYTDETGSSTTLELSSLSSANVLVYNKADDSTLDYSTSQTGTYTYSIAPTADNNYSVRARRAGYTEAELDFDPSGGGEFTLSGSLSQRLSLTGASLYTGAGNDANVTFDWSDKLILLQGAVTYSAQQLFDIAQRAQITENGLKLDAIMDFDGDSNILLLDGWQIKNGDTLTPTIQAFVSTDDSRDIIETNGSVQVREVANANAFKQDQIITLQNQLVTMLELMQGSSYDTNNGDFANVNGTLLNVMGPNFNGNDHALDEIIDTMIEEGIMDANTMRDMLQ